MNELKLVGAGDSNPPDSVRLTNKTGKHVLLATASDLTPVHIEWVWEGYLAAGKMHLIAGAPSTGKTTLTLALAATVSVGGMWPDGTSAPRGKVVIWSGEDNVEDTLLPRLIAAGADRDNVRFATTTVEKGRSRAFDPARDLAELSGELRTLGDVRLLVVDSVVSVVAGDSHKNAEVRRGLESLVALAAEVGCAVVGITHFTKGTAGLDPLDRVTGSLAFAAVARVVLVTAKQEATEGQPGRRVLMRAKSNLGPENGGFEYRVVAKRLAQDQRIEVSVVEWGEVVRGSTRQVLLEMASQNGESEQGAGAWLKRTLESGPVEARAVLSSGIEAGFTEREVRRAFKSLGGAKKKGGYGPGHPWRWRLPSE